MTEASNRLASLSPAKQELLKKVLKAARPHTQSDRPHAQSDREEAYIPRRPQDVSPPLSFAQQRLWFLDQLEGPSATYNMPNAVRLDGPFNPDAMKSVFQEVIRRHEALRTNFIEDNGQPIQIIHDRIECAFPLIDLQALDPCQREAELTRLAHEAAQRPFDLAADQLLRLILVRLAPEQHVLLMNIHHIVSDGWSIGKVLLREMLTLYEAFSHGQPSPLPELPIQYADFACWQREWLRDAHLETELAYWRTQLSDMPALLELPTDRPRPPMQTFRGSTHYFAIERALVERLKALGQSYNASLFMTVLAGFSSLLARYSRQDTIVVGSPIANRQRKELEPLIGFFVNSLALRIECGEDPSGSDLITQVRDTCLAAYRHQDAPFERLVEALQPERNLSFSPLFQVMLILQNQNDSRADLHIGDLHITAMPQNAATSMFDLTLKLEETEAGIAGELEYNTDLFDAATISRFASQYRILLAGMASAPEMPLSRLPLLDEVERQQILFEWNATQRDYPWRETVYDLFAQQARQQPDRLAVLGEGAQLTYGALLSRVNQLARYLHQLGVGPETLVGVCLDRSVDMLVGLLGILRAGAAYLPLDPTYPKDRLALMIKHSGLSFVLTQATTADALPESEAHRIDLDRDRAAMTSANGSLPAVHIGPDALAYVIYTSGSTGVPKGVQISHASLLNFLLTMLEKPGLGPGDTLLAVTTISFDIAGLELYLPLLVGARIALVSRETAADGFQLFEALRETAATVMQATPATWRLLLATDWPRCAREATNEGSTNGLSLQRVFCGGEALSGDLAAQLLATGAEVWNLYGPTETTIWSTIAQVTRPQHLAETQSDDDQDAINTTAAKEAIGYPIGNTQVYILDANGQPAPIGIPGELYIGGAGLSRGYLHQAAMTAERFLPDPFSLLPGARVYRTGDLSRFLANGRIGFLGRVDHQIKIRGFRIELGEIEAVLDRHPAVRNAVAVCREDEPNNQQLVAYVELDANASSTALAQETEQNAPDIALDQLEKWQTVWSQTYGNGESATLSSVDLSGWLSSYSGEPIPEAEMQVWIDATVDRILALKPRRVLEIGCGTGLLLSQIAPHVDEYVGTDFSAAVLQRLQARVEAWGFKGVRLLQREALAFDPGEQRAFDMIIVNSVMQYFPGVDYLVRVLEEAVNAVVDGGHIFLGDVRALPLLELQHASVLFYQAADACSRDELRRRVATQTEREEELLLDACVFTALQTRLPRISQVAWSLKRGVAANEMTKFRYDVVLRIGASDDKSQTHIPPSMVSIDAGRQANIHDVQQSLTELISPLESEPEIVVIRNLLNQRVHDDVQVLDWLSGGVSPETVGELRRHLQQEPAAGIAPEDVWAWGESLGYAVSLSWAAEEPTRCFDAVWRRLDTTAGLNAIPMPPANLTLVAGSMARDEPFEQYANDPLRSARTRVVVNELRRQLEAQLPAYMAPSAIICLDRLPLTPNGKIDRRALPAPDFVGLDEVYVAPRTATEEQLAEIWAEVLGLERIGVNDNFFGLGGHSLLAIQVISKIRDAFAIEPSIQALFDAPTIAQLAERLATSSTHTQPILPAIPVLSAEARQAAPLSFAQQRLWFLDQLEGSSVTYHISGAVRIHGVLNLPALEQTFTEIIRRHEVLRTNFTKQDGKPVQTMSPPRPLRLHVAPLDSLSAEAQERELQHWLATENERPFALDRDLLFRVTLLRLAPQAHLMLLTMHHIISDEWSIGLLLQEVTALYQAFSDGQPSPLPELPVQYADYADWQRQWLTGDILKTQLAYWTEQLADAPAVLELPTDRPRPQIQRYRGRTQTFQIDATLTAQIKALGQESEATLFMTLLGGFGVLLSRLSHHTDLVIGSPIANRNRTELEGLIGFFVNSLPLRLDLSGNPHTRELLSRMRQTALAAYAHQDVPFEHIVEELQPERSLSYAPIFQVMFVLQNAPMPDMRLDDLSLEMVDPETVAAKFDLTLSIEEAGGLNGFIEYNTDLFDQSTIARFIEQYRRLLAGMVENPAHRIMALPWLSEAERQQILVGWNTTVAPAPQHRLIHLLFEAQADRTPDHIALAQHGMDRASLSYLTLNRQANRVAHQLRDVGVGPDVLVGLYVEPSFAMIIGLLAIIKAGGAYMPLVPGTPQDRLAFMLHETQAPLVLTQLDLMADLPTSQAQLLSLEQLLQTSAPETNLDNLTQPDNLAYLIYTSGSTGQPKAAQVSHANLAYSTQARLSYYDAPFSGLLLLQPFGFDVATGAIFWTLCQGACLYLEPRNLAQDPHQLLARIVDTQVSHLILLPLLYAPLLDLATRDQLASIRLVITGGEQMPANLIQKHADLAPQATLFNEYGPTEATIWCSVFKTEQTEPLVQRAMIPIGRPTPHTRIYILDEQLDPAPVGVLGELYIAGPQVARGYLRHPVLSAETFIPDPFTAEPGARMYKTGDMARYQTDGNVEFLGRLDQQVKVRGFRIELGEIEVVLNRHPAIREAAVVVESPTGQTGGGKRLVAYLVCSAQPVPERDALRSYLQTLLPDYMLPSAFVFLDALPLTANGKLDVRALPAPNGEDRESAYLAPRTPTETLLAAIWEEVLGQDSIGIHDNFFALGGDSILSIQIISRASRSGLHLTVKQLFQHQTIADLARVTPERQVAHAEQTTLSGPVAITPIQAWFVDAAPPEPHYFNQSVLLKLVGGLDAAHIEQTIHYLMIHHDMLRARFTWPNADHARAEPLRAEIVGSSETIPFSVRDLTQLSDSDKHAALLADAQRQQASLDLSQGPLLRAVFYRMGRTPDDDTDRLLLIIHHLVVDGISWRILVSDFETAMRQLRRAEPIHLPPKTTSFQYWAERLAAYAGSPQVTAELDYWQEQASVATRPLPLDLIEPQAAREANSIDSADHHTVSLSAALTQALLHETPQAYHTQINDVLLTALARTFTGWTKEACLAITLEGHGREDLFAEVDVSRTVGWFTTGFPVVLPSVAEEGVGARLKRVKEGLRRIPHNGIGYGLLRYLSPDPAIRKRLSALSEAEVSFNYLGRFDNEGRQASDARDAIVLGEAFEPTGSDQSHLGRRRFILEINSLLSQGQLQLTWTYSRNLHQRQTIEQLAQGFLTELEAIIEHCRSEDAGGYTASDFPLANLEMEHPVLERLFQRWRHNIDDTYPLSPMQEGMLFHSLYDDGSGAYVIQMACKMSGAFQPRAFRDAWQQVLDRHPSLRTVFVSEDGAEPLQVALKQTILPWQDLDWRGQPEEEQRERLTEFLRVDRLQGFVVDEPPLMRCTLIRLQDQTWQLVWSHHHLLTDGWCLPILMREVLHFYTAFLERHDTHVDLPYPRLYRDYIAWLADQDASQAETFWRDYLSGFCAPTPFGVDPMPAQTDLSAALADPMDPAPVYAECALELDPSTSQALQRLAQQHRLTVSILIQGAWAGLLSRYSGESDVVFGATVSGRPPELADVDSMVGLFINTLPVRARIDAAQPLLSFLTELRDGQLARDSYAYTPLVELHAWSEVPARQPLFESIVVFENYPMEEALEEQAGALSIQDVQLLEQTTFPLTLTAAAAARIPLRLAYDCSRFDAATIERMLGRLHKLLDSLVTQPQQTMATWTRESLLGEDERRKLVVELNQTRVEHAAGAQTVPQLFAAQAQRTPSRIAVVFEDQQLSYAQLNRRANQVAHHLRSLGVRPGSLVAVYMERSIDMLIALLGIQKSGAAYVPLDPAYPKERLAFMLEDARVAVVLTQQRLCDAFPQTQAQVLCLDDPGGVISAASQTDPVPMSGPEDLAYVIYTSGSTGQPKGVQISQRALVNFLQSMAHTPGLSEHDVLLGVTTISFDIAGLELYLPLLVGATLGMVSREAAADGFRLWGEMERLDASVMQATPATWRLLLEAGWQGAPLRRAFCGGEGLPRDLAAALLDTGVDVWNLYGPTETTIWSAAHPVTRPMTRQGSRSSHADAHEPIGRPIDNTTLYVVDRALYLAPMGTPGELLIGGDGLALGYLGQPALTAEKFAPDPFGAKPGGRVYRTGDLVRYREDDSLLFLGRMDHQVKIRGFRIELGEIEALLNERPEVQQAVVTTWQAGAEDNRLAAYVVTENGEALDIDTVRVWLRDKLPAYMLPSELVCMDRFPLTPNAKLDRRALPTPHRQRLMAYAPPRTSTEEQLAVIFADVLSVERVGITDDFFELGGHSLLAAKFVSRIKQAFELMLPLPVLFQQPTIDRLAEYIDTTRWAAQQGRAPESALQEDEEEITL